VIRAIATTSVLDYHGFIEPWLARSSKPQAICFAAEYYLLSRGLRVAASRRLYVLLLNIIKPWLARSSKPQAICFAAEYYFFIFILGS